MPKKSRLRAVDPSLVFVDSGAWIALFSARDQHHAEADRLFRRAFSKRIQLVTTSLVLAEVHRLLLYRAGSRAADFALKQIDTSSLVRIEFAGPEHHQGALKWLDKLSGQTLTYTDAVSFAIMQDLRCSVAMSFDHDFLVAGFSQWRET